MALRVFFFSNDYELTYYSPQKYLIYKEKRYIELHKNQTYNAE